MLLKKISLLLVFILILVVTGCSSTTSKDCGKDLSCFVSAAESCSLAKVEHKIFSDLYGQMVQEIGEKYELVKSADGKCIFNIAVINSDLKFPDSKVKEMKAKGTTQEQIDQLLKLTKSNSAPIVGKFGSCKGDTSVISAMLKKWQKGSFAKSDWDNLNCTGSYFKDIDPSSLHGVGTTPVK